MQCCCHCPIFRHLLRSPGHICSFPRTPSHDRVAWQRLLPSSSRQGTGPQWLKGAPSHFPLPGLVPQHPARGGRWAHTAEFSIRSTEAGGLNTLKAPISLCWLYGRVGVVVFAMQVPEGRRRERLFPPLPLSPSS